MSPWIINQLSCSLYFEGCLQVSLINWHAVCTLDPLRSQKRCVFTLTKNEMSTRCYFPLGDFWSLSTHFFCQCPRPFLSIVFATLVLKEEEIKLWSLTVKATADLTEMWVISARGPDGAVSAPGEVRWKVDGNTEPTYEYSVSPSLGQPNPNGSHASWLRLPISESPLQVSWEIPWHQEWPTRVFLARVNNGIGPYRGRGEEEDVLSATVERRGRVTKMNDLFWRE